jgi:pyrroloquinoline-quinone synthase
MTSYDEGACAMYAFEKEIPKISKTKIEGLKNFYGLDNNNSIQYFEEHMTADIRHTASWKKIIDNSSKSDAELLEIAKKSIDAQNLLLDSCYEAYC